MAVYNDRAHKVEAVMDQELWEADTFLFHPLVNTSTLVIEKGDVERFLASTGHELTIVAVPEN